MALALTCPHCEDRPVETTRNAWFIQGFLIIARYGSRSYVGCVSCTRNKVLGSLLLSSLLGWWCFPWGLGTPLVILQNLVSIASGPDRRGLATALLQQGLDIDELELDDSGRSAGQLALVDGILSTLHSVTWADGSADEREVETGVEIATQMLGKLVDPDEVRAVLTDAKSPGELDATSFGVDSRLMLLRAAGEIAAADEVIEDSEVDELRALGERLNLPPELVDAFIGGLYADEDTQAEQDSMRQIARDILGISEDTALAAVQSAYRAKKMEAIANQDEEASEEHLEELEWAYQTLLS